MTARGVDGTRKASASRLVGYTIEAPNGFDEAKVQRLLKVAERAGVVARGQWDTGRGRLVWFNGPPGPRLRALRVQIAALVGVRS